MKILGISCYYHDSAAALLIDGKVMAAAEEERFSRIKHDSNYPQNAIEFCLKYANIAAGDLNYVVFYEKPFLKVDRVINNFLETVPNASTSFVHAAKTLIKSKLWIKEKIAKSLNIETDKILFANHHDSHAAVTFYTSPFKKAAILTCDGVGEWATTTWGTGNNNRIDLKQEVHYPHSLGLFYSAFTQFLGFTVNEGEFKVMGLAPYGKPVFKDKIEKMIQQSADGAFKLDLSYFAFSHSDTVAYSQKFIDLLGIVPQTPSNSDKVEQVYADIAASAQQVLEEKLLLIAKNIRQKSGESNLVYSGGVALNGVANHRIFKEAGFKNIFIHPAAGDSGGALGGALYLHHDVLKKTRIKPLTNVYLGNKNTDKQIVKFLTDNKIKYQKVGDNALIKKITSMMVSGKVIGWVRGRAEWGPRALGNRSILADPRSISMKKRVNAKIKFREAFRPFAPVTIYEKATTYYDIKPKDIQQPLEYMIEVVPVLPQFHKHLGAITHVDGTARPQLIRKEKNPIYYKLVKEFGNKTGIYTLLNTSFNLKGEPIVNTIGDAYNTFSKSGLDALVIENYLVLK
jgi:carbamoyltransferase